MLFQAGVADPQLGLQVTGQHGIKVWKYVKLQEGRIVGEKACSTKMGIPLSSFVVQMGEGIVLDY